MRGLALRLLTSGDRSERLQVVMPVAAVAVAVLLLLMTLGAYTGFADRGAREAWRMPVEATGEPTAVQAVAYDHLGEQMLTRVEYAPLSADAPVPPGLDALPQPGELWVSPALAGEIDARPAAELADRYDAAVTGEIGPDGLVHPGELVAIVGMSPDDPALQEARSFSPWWFSHSEEAVTTSGLSTTPSHDAETYNALAMVGAVVMVIPLVAVSASASRLVAARRNRRLSMLRLIGASVRQVVGITTAETALLGAAGAVIGTGAYALLMPAVARIGLAGGTWFTSDLWIGWPLLGATLTGVVGLLIVIAVAGLVPVVRDPFSTVRSQRPGRARLWRLLAVVAAFVVVGMAGDMTALAIAVVIGVGLGALMLVGPFVVGLIGRIGANSASSAERLLAYRRLADDPRAGWRAIAGLVLAGFLAGFMSVTTPIGGMTEDGPPTVSVTVPEADGPEALAAVETALADVQAPWEIEVITMDWLADPADRIEVVLGADRAGLEEVRTALSGIQPGLIATATADGETSSALFLSDIRTGVLVVLASAFLVAAVTAAVGSVAYTLDQRGALAVLRHSGAPLSVLVRARRMQLTVPMVVLAGGSTVFGLALASLLMLGSFQIDVQGLAVTGGLIVIGLALVLGADALGRPVLARATADLSVRE